MLSSTSSSCPEPRGRAWVLFGALFLLLFVPYEAAVRRSEAVFGEAPAAVPSPEGEDQIDAWLQRLRTGEPPAVYAVGSSIALYGFDPEVLAQGLGEPTPTAYTLGL